jgi:Glycine zipper
MGAFQQKELIMKRLVLVLAVLAFFAGQASAQQRAKDGAVLGGLAGAVIGGVVGHQNDESTEGILIGGAVGAIAGGLAGHAQDKVIARERCYQQQIYNQQVQLQNQQQTRIVRVQPSQVVTQTQTQVVTVPSPYVTVDDVLTMSRSGLGDQVIINHIQANGVQRRLQVKDILFMHQQGVSEPVMTAMQAAVVRPTQVRTVNVVPAQTTVVQETVHVNPQPVRQTTRYYQYR